MNAKIDSKNPTLDYESQFYRSALLALKEADIPFLIGGSFAFTHFTSIRRFTKDMDIFIEPRNREKVLALFSDIKTQQFHWLIKIVSESGLYMDVIFNSGNGICPVDEHWFDFAESGQLWDVPVIFCPLEETIWMKAFIMERDRYDGADIAHFLYHCSHRIKWKSLLQRFGPHWRVLLSHLILFGFSFPDKRAIVPALIMNDLLDRLIQEQSQQKIIGKKMCRGTLLSSIEYRQDVEMEGYLDPRLFPLGTMSRAQIQEWEKHVLDDRKG